MALTDTMIRTAKPHERPAGDSGAMIPAERRAGYSLSLSVAGDPAWATAKQALRYVYGPGGVAVLNAGSVLIDNCRLGFVSAKAVLMQRADGGRAGTWSHEGRE